MIHEQGQDYLLDSIGDICIKKVNRMAMTISNSSYWTEEQKDKLGDAVGKAIRHAKRVVVREHIKSDRVDRVNHFITSLRREIGYVLSSDPSAASRAVGYICDKFLWHDIGISNGNLFLQELVQIASRKSSSVSAQSDLILADLEELERGLVGVRHTISDAERINREGEQVVARLCEVFQ